MTACREHSVALSRLVDGELSPDRAEPVLAHLAVCEACRETRRLLEVESETLRTVLSGPDRARAPRRLPARHVWVAAILLVVLGVGLWRLHGAYLGMGARLHAARQAEVEAELLSQSILVRSRGRPLPDLLETISGESGVPIRLSKQAARRLGLMPKVHIDLVRPIRLRSLIGLLEGFYDLHARVDGKSVVLT